MKIQSLAALLICTVTAGGEVFSNSYNPSSFNQMTGINWPFDPFHIAMSSATIVVGCFGDHMHALILYSNQIVWDWAKPSGGWIGPFAATK